MIPLSMPTIGAREIEYVTQVLRSGRLSLGPLLGEFECRFAKYVGEGEAVAVSSGTSALHLIVKSLGIGAQDEVLTTSFSFAASTNCLLYEGAVPVFVDIDPATLNLDPSALRATITREYVWNAASGTLTNRRSGRRAKAILAVHVFGMPCAMEALAELAEEFGLLIIEDACEALGAIYRGRRVGQFSDAAAFGFYPNKQITTAEGGMIVTKHPEVAAQCRSLRNQGRNETDAWLRHDELGYNYRLSELHCALGLAQLERVDEFCTARAEVARHYGRRLAKVPGIAPLVEQPHSTRSWFVYVLQLSPLLDIQSTARARDELILALRERGIACQAYFPAIHRQPYIQRIRSLSHVPLPHTDYAAASCVALPLFPSMTTQQVDYVCDAVRALVPHCLIANSSMDLTHSVRGYAERSA